jgi:hypothetical protein
MAEEDDAGSLEKAAITEEDGRSGASGNRPLPSWRLPGEAVGM